MKVIKETIDYLTNHKKTGYNTCQVRRRWLAAALESYIGIKAKFLRKDEQSKALKKKIKEIKSIILTKEGLELPGWNDYSELLDEIREIINS